jgi:hypothetical protein
MRKLLLLLAALSAPASAQTVEDRLEKAREEVNASQNAASRALYAIDRALETVRAEPTPTPEPTPEPTPTPTPEPDPLPEPPIPEPEEQPDGTVALPIVEDGLDVSTLVRATGQAAPAPDTGSFRFLCYPSHIINDDPIVWPGQPGMAHPHTMVGNTETNAFSTYETLRTTGDSTCMNAGNRSAYWEPTLQDDKNYYLPDYISIYYKRQPADHPQWAQRGDIPVDTPRGLRFVYGWPDRTPAFRCMKVGIRRDTLAQAVTECGGLGQISISMESPECWNGRELDTPDHRSHIAEQQQDRTGLVSCPDTHPYAIPVFTAQSVFTLLATDNVAALHLSSDFMAPDLPPGATFHRDWLGAWNDEIMDTWHANCINRKLTCASGDLGNATSLNPTEFYKAIRALGPQRVPLPAHQH